MIPRVERLALSALLLAAVGIRSARLDQPIVENYVGRQVPTAMAARNLDRGSGLLRPQLDTGPFPNLFLVEPPIYAALVAGLDRISGLGIGPSGRLVSALATGLGAWGLFGLARRREGPGVALMAVAAFATLPVMVRYGRAVQPDALMIGTQLAALRCWDAHGAEGGRLRLLAAWALLAASLALKVTSTFIYIPLFLVILRPPRVRLLLLALAAILPALAWYAYASGVIAEGDGSRAMLDNGRIWASALLPSALIDPETYRPAARFLFIRSFTPIGLALAVWGLARTGTDRLWRIWSASAMAALVALAAKWHHEYYWMTLAPAASVGIARALASVSGASPGNRRWAWALGLATLGMGVAASVSTWRTPVEWAALEEAAASIRANLPPEAIVVAPEALLFAADRRGCRWEPTPSAASRAAGEWGGRLEDPDDPIALVEFYRSRGADALAILTTGTGPDPLRRLAKQRYRVLAERPGFLLVALEPRGLADGASR